jgi:hypothetical protein
MKVVIIGASGTFGSVIRDEALSRGHLVTAICRHPEKIAVQNPNLHIVKADIVKDAVDKLLCGHEAVIVAYNPVPGFIHPDLVDMHLKGSKAIISGVKKSGVKRLLYVGGAGSLEVAPGVRLLETGVLPDGVKQTSQATFETLQMLRKENELEWTFLCPAPMTRPGKRTGHFRVGKDQPVKNEEGKSEISMQDYAVAMINELENPQHTHERWTAAY